MSDDKSSCGLTKPNDPRTKIVGAKFFPFDYGPNIRIPSELVNIIPLELLDPMSAEQFVQFVRDVRFAWQTGPDVADDLEVWLMKVFHARSLKLIDQTARAKEADSDPLSGMPYNIWIKIYMVTDPLLLWSILFLPGRLIFEYVEETKDGNVALFSLKSWEKQITPHEFCLFGEIQHTNFATQYNTKVGCCRVAFPPFSVYKKARHPDRVYDIDVFDSLSLKVSESSDLGTFLSMLNCSTVENYNRILEFLEHSAFLEVFADLYKPEALVYGYPKKQYKMGFMHSLMAVFCNFSCMSIYIREGEQYDWLAIFYGCNMKACGHTFTGVPSFTSNFHGVPNPLSSIVLLSLGLLLENGDANGQRITVHNFDACFDVIGKILDCIDAVFGTTYGVTLYKDPQTGEIGEHPIKTAAEFLAHIKGMYMLEYRLDAAKSKENEAEDAEDAEENDS